MSISANKNLRLRIGQAGMASILVTMVMMIVISLIVLGFAQISRRNQREALDNQLSNQAFYAAETGVNDYANYIRSYLAGPSPVTASLSQNSCTPNSAYLNKVPASGSLSSSPDVGYTCVLVDASPTSLIYSSVGSNPLIIPVNSATTLNSLTLSWQTTRTDLTNPANGCPAAANVDQLPTVSGWASRNCGLGLLRLDLLPTSGGLTLQNMQANTMTALLVPTNPAATGSGTLSYAGAGNNQYLSSAANQAAVVAAKCDPATGGCSVTINNLSSPNYYLRVSSIYETAAIQVAGYNSTTGSAPMTLTGAQVLIDSTGKAQDILRRIQVRIPVNATAGASTFDAAIQSSSALCKQFQTYSGYAANIAAASSCSLP